MRKTRWNFDGTVSLQRRNYKLDRTKKVVGYDYLPGQWRESSPWWWGITDQTKPTAPWWDHEKNRAKE